MVLQWIVHRENGSVRSYQTNNQTIENKNSLAWLDPETYWPDRDKEKDNNSRNKRGSSIDSSQDDSSRKLRNKRPKIPRPKSVTDNALHPTEGLLACRLVHDPPHWPIDQETTKSKCALHYWACQIDHQKQIVQCSICKIHLCTYCFKKFHTKENLVGDKDNICNTLLERILSKTG
jgi:hypothetical protein